MVDVASPKHDLEDAQEVRVEVSETPDTPSKSSMATEITRLPDSDDEYDDKDDKLPISTPPLTHSTYHIYSHDPFKKLITPTPDATRDRRSGPKISELKACRKDKKARKASGLPPVDPDPNAFFLHQPYLAFHIPPQVLYLGNSKHGSSTPTVLIHPSCFWRKYTLQLGPFLATPGVLDPRGVVSWRHNGGDKKALKRDEHALKGYKVRTWRLWGETGKAYVKKVKKIRQTGDGVDPDVLNKENKPVRADEVVTLSWTSPFSIHTRRYHFRYRGVDFYWKGTGTVRESRACGWFLRFSHLKLVARAPCMLSGDDEKKDKGEDDWVEICLARFTSSVAKEKSGVLEVFDAAVLRLVEESMPSVLDEVSVKGSEKVDDVLHQSNDGKILALKKSTLYQVIVATATCMIAGEKEKRHTIIDVIIGAAEQGGGGGG